jgi:hypothetical protein
MVADLFLRWQTPSADLTGATSQPQNFLFSGSTIVFFFFTSQVLALSAFFLIPLSTLVVVQLGNFRAGLTTTERFSR